MTKVVKNSEINEWNINKYNNIIIICPPIGANIYIFNLLLYISIRLEPSNDPFAASKRGECNVQTE